LTLSKGIELNPEKRCFIIDFQRILRNWQIKKWYKALTKVCNWVLSERGLGFDQSGNWNSGS
jgi:hypothetical protein